MRKSSGSLIFMVCSITYHYKYLLWFTLLSGSFSLSPSLALFFCLFLTLGKPSSCSYQWITVIFFFLSLGFRKSAFFISYLSYALSSCCFFLFFCFTIRLLMVFRCCSDSLCDSLPISAWMTFSSARAFYPPSTENMHIMHTGVCLPPSLLV